MKLVLVAGLVASTVLLVVAQTFVIRHLRVSENDARRELASAQTRAVMCEQTAELADRVILTCLSQQTVVKMELQSLGFAIRNQQPKECK